MEQAYGSHLSVLTWNLYLGVDLAPLMTIIPAQMPKRVTQVFQQFLATNLPCRVKAIAREIASKKPDLIGLQEAVEWQLMIPNHRTITYDFISLLLLELKKYSLHYEVAVENQNVSAQLPDSNGNLIHLLDRDVILIRQSEGITITNKDGAHFKRHLTVNYARQRLEILRGWVMVDIIINGRKCRVINTHLEESAMIQLEQANEIMNKPAQTKLPLIFLGDLNSNANGEDTPTYSFLLNKGWIDLWKEVGKGPGYTFGQSPDLLNSVSGLKQRIDYILFKNGWEPKEASLVGSKQSSRTTSGLWPSDHAGVFGKLLLSD